MFDSSTSFFNSSTQELNISISISWTAPQRLNGLLSGYLFSVQSTSGSVVYENSETPLDVVMVQVMVIVRPYELYSVTINATGGGGSSSATSGSVRSPVAGQLIYHQFSARV